MREFSVMFLCVFLIALILLKEIYNNSEISKEEYTKLHQMELEIPEIEGIYRRFLSDKKVTRDEFNEILSFYEFCEKEAEQTKRFLERLNK